ncbi:MAG: hypothetical protein UX91_C0001G0051 [Candidatus Amesbacteria bacterium GW2011_GWB1_47_19]|nr:MAG: hypothetical protein UW51_C0001G0051 [Candidatus Amesbacteria bacterium GW2011_GWA1_44_24]KKU32063.1 MAG: Glycosyl transferase group 1 [Candidatus Amesbacteria bacterium GW2011_GWC1_46_24]KKU67747.1 MAG: hypothetical protein UX91_C0001G0051 [Candidatus Amesbacteria bacterium GW2011_GWB1_47_19]OGD06068.1 MAG: hypothetical protein A2379_03170 [Candidatus Amesbacteria bacterium RIFOXYB1_FULL_47_13]HBC72342.1 hypothetical protein [Candidatus Amesbacteria bacterium]
MRVVSCLTYYRPYISGLAVYGQRLAEGLARKGAESEVLCFMHRSDLKTEEESGGVKIVRAKPWFKISKGFISPDWVRKMIKAVSRADTVVVHWPGPEGVSAVLWARILGKKVISIYHCQVQLPDGIVRKRLERLLNISERMGLGLSQTVVNSSQDYAINSPVLAGMMAKIKYIYPPVEIPGENKAVRNRIHKMLGRHRPVIGFAGRLAAEKGVEYLLEAIAYLKTELKDIRVVICGPQETAGESEYRRKIASLVRNLRKEVVFIGQIPDGCMGSFYKFLDVLVLPSVNSTEAFGMVQAEAMMSGVPVVTSDLPGVRVPVTKTGMGRLAKPGDAGELARAISEILRNRKKYVRTQKALEEFDMNKSMDAFAEIAEL